MREINEWIKRFKWYSTRVFIITPKFGFCIGFGTDWTRFWIGFLLLLQRFLRRLWFPAPISQVFTKSQAQNWLNRTQLYGKIWWFILSHKRRPKIGYNWTEFPLRFGKIWRFLLYYLRLANCINLLQLKSGVLFFLLIAFRPELSYIIIQWIRNIWNLTESNWI